MSDIAIQVEHLSKQYRIGSREPYLVLRDVLAGFLSAPIRSVRSRVQKVTRATGPPRHRGGDGYIWALKDVSFEVKEQEVIGIIGRNGAGKTTLLKILSRITKPTSGYAEVRGRVGSLLEVGTGFHQELTGRENVFLNGAILGMKKAEIDRKFDEIVAFAEVEKFIDTPVKFYSSGMYVRLAFAVAAYLEPEILLVDEVLAVGDFEFQQKCLGKVREVSREGRTVLFVSHNMAAVNRLCTRGILMDAGSITAIGDVQTVVSKYLSQGQSSSGLVKVEIGNREVAIIHEVGILNAAGEFSTSVPVNQEFCVWIVCEIRKKLDYAQIALAVLVTDGTVVFVSTHADTRSPDDLSLMPGTYRAKVAVPGNFLNVGTYILNVRIFGQRDGDVRSAHADGFYVLQFRVEETGSVASKLNDQRRGLVTPTLNWEFV